MSEVKKTKVHLISGFLGTGKTTALKSLMAQKDPNEKWVIIVNEFGEIGIDGAVLSDNGIPVAEIAGGCLCCTAGAQMGTTVQKMLRDAQPDRLMIEASGLAHAASVIDELKAKPSSENSVSINRLPVKNAPINAAGKPVIRGIMALRKICFHKICFSGKPLARAV